MTFAALIFMKLRIAGQLRRWYLFGYVLIGMVLRVLSHSFMI